MMSCSGWCLTATPWLAFACNIVSNIALLRGRRTMSIVWSLVWSFLVGCMAFVACAASWCHGREQADGAARLAAAFLTYACASYVFFHVVHIPEASVRIRVLQELAAHGPLAEGELLRRYDARTILDLRLARLMRSGQLTHMDGRYFTGRRRMLYVARLFRLAKRIALGAGQ